MLSKPEQIKFLINWELGLLPAPVPPSMLDVRDYITVKRKDVEEYFDDAPEELLKYWEKKKETVKGNTITLELINGEIVTLFFVAIMEALRG